MGAVAICVEGLVKEGKAGWAFVAPEVGHSQHGWVDGMLDLVGMCQGVLEGLNWASRVGYTKVLVHSSDPVFMVQMLEGLSSEGVSIQALWWRVKALEEHFQQVVYFSVGAEENLPASDLCRKLATEAAPSSPAVASTLRACKPRVSALGLKPS